MNVRLKKEFQNLYWPWLITALVGLLPVLSWMLPSGQYEQAFGRIYLISGVAFILGTALLAALPFGEEFHLRTLPILLSQPVSRIQVWREKLGITLLLIASAALIHTIGYLPFLNLIQDEAKMVLSFLTFSICSGVFWVLVARSTLGGAVLCLFSQALVLVLAFFFTERDYFAKGTTTFHSGTGNLVALFSAILSPAFLWLGWRKFAAMQLASHWETDGSTGMEGTQSSFSIRLFRSRSDSPLFNLLLKEIRLVRPVAVIAFLFSCVWLLAVVLSHVMPHKHGTLSDVLNGLLAIYCPLVLLVSGCISLGEEKTLGLHQANLNLPVPLYKQWALKIAMALTVGLSSGVFLPLLLAKLDSILLSGRHFKTVAWTLLNENAALWNVAPQALIMIALGFWCVSLFNRITQSALFAVITILYVMAAGSFGSFVGSRMDWLAEKPIIWITVEFELPLSWYSQHRDLFHNGSLIAVGLVVLGLSWWSYRRQDLSSKKIVAAYSALALAVFLISLPIGYLNRFADHFHLHESNLAREAMDAIRLLSYRDTIDSGHELIIGARLAPDSNTARWLKNVEIKVHPGGFMLAPRDKPPIPYRGAELRFPNGGKDYLMVKMEHSTNQPANPPK